MGRRNRKQQQKQQSKRWGVKMSKIIKMTPDVEAECRKAFELALSAGKFADGKFSFSKSFANEERKATVIYTEEAWAKQCRVLKEFDKEVAWHGVCHRGEDESKDEYIITDILVYPQTVSAATVEMDTEEYAKWLMENCEDERFDNIHAQMHSHVNMGTSPSSVDLHHQEEILNMLGDEDFYIFMIWNKSLSKTNKIYDLKKNVLFEDKDIVIAVEGQATLDDFIKDAKSRVKNRTYTTSAGSYTGGYSGTYSGAQTARPLSPTYTPYNPLASQKAPATTPPNVVKANEVKTGQSTSGEKPRTRIGAGWAGRNASQMSFPGFGGGWGDADDYNAAFFGSDR